MKVNQKNYVNFAFLILFLGILFTVTITDDFLWQGVVTAKYFWFATVMCIVSVLIPLSLPKKGEIHVTDLLLGILVVYFCVNYFFLNNHPGMHWWLTLLMVPLYVAVRVTAANGNMRRWLTDALLVVVLVEAVWGLLQLYGFTYSNHSLYKVTGSLFNPGPYSGFVAVGIPLALGYALDKTLPRWERWLGIVTLAAALLVLPVAMSRAAWLAAITGSAVTVIQNSRFKIQNSRFNIRGWRLVGLTVVTGVLAIGLLAGAYLMKKDSADGRWVIWRVNVEAIKEHPLFGAGYGRFAAVYGNAQAAFFLDGNGTEAQTMVADSPEYAFNEYVQMAVELGIVGLVLFLLVVGSSLITRHLSPVTCHPSLVTLLVFAAFSYPFSILPLGILFVFLLALSASSSRKLSFTLPSILRSHGLTILRFGVAACWGITAYGAYQILPKQAAYREWSTLQMLYNANAFKEAAKEYKAWYPQLRHEKQFLFEYGQCLSKIGQYEESNLIFEQYLCYGSDPMVYNCLGNNYKEMGKYNQAENAYIRASKIVPNRHYPLYLLMKLYQEIGQVEKAKAMADALLRKPVKVPSTAIKEMQEEAREMKNEK